MLKHIKRQKTYIHTGIPSRSVQWDIYANVNSSQLNISLTLLFRYYLLINIQAYEIAPVSRAYT